MHSLQRLMLIPQHRGISPQHQDWVVLVQSWKKHKLALTDHELLVMTLSHLVNVHEVHNLLFILPRFITSVRVPLFVVMALSQVMVRIKTNPIGITIH
ncbi:Protein of unknown function [Anaplasma phagocytophilum]|uniref:Uncharacterized protein n=1 Tax=Anaplasma phagocytophilum TaxID=948 RepID=A0A098EF03_ANAPH|nr:Protein of unknown function [Anaplasma phagocytophilum]